MVNTPGVADGMLDEPESVATHAPARRKRDKPGQLDLLTHRQLVGYLGAALPLGVYVLAGFVPTQGLDNPWQALDSISAYYYTGAGNFFEGVLFGIGWFLVTYPGYQNVLADRLVGVVGGLAALGVALFPTEAPRGVTAASWWTDTIGHVHVTSAVVLFTVFAAFALWLFPKSEVPRWRDRPAEKRRRDVCCYVCGAAIVACMAWIGVLAVSSLVARQKDPTLPGPDIIWPEGIAILAFAIAWLVKGEAPASIGRKLQQAKQMVAS